MTSICALSNTPFDIPEAHLSLYEKFEVPLPTISPIERARRRMQMSNQYHLFRRPCAATGKSIVTNFPPDGSSIVYDINYWHTGAWDCFATGRNFDFTRPFFEQFQELIAATPRPSVIRAYEFDDNSEYTNHSGQNKDCYFIFDSDQCRECYYCYSINCCVDCIDCFRLDSCELCYECLDCVRCYNSRYLQNCLHCSDSAFLRNCIGCSHCFGCVNFKNKQYCFFNKQLDPRAYQQQLKAFDLSSRTVNKQLLARFNDFARQYPARATEGTQNQNVIGDYLFNCKNAYQCFDSRQVEDSAFITQAFGATKNSLDCTEIGDNAELIYETSYCGLPAYFVRFSSLCYPNVQYLTYCYYVKNSRHCFGCAGLKNAEYSVLNQRYSESEYRELTKKIIEHMRETGEWGQFFPASLAPVPYNLSHAHDFLPLTRAEALDRGYRWWDEEKAISVDALSPPDRIGELMPTDLGQTYVCSATQQPFRLQPPELLLYQKLGVPAPELVFALRHQRRLQARNSREIRIRSCDRCRSPVGSTVSEEQNSRVLCEQHFQEALD